MSVASPCTPKNQNILKFQHESDRHSFKTQQFRDGTIRAVYRCDPMLKIESRSNGSATILHLIGRIQAQHLEDLTDEMNRRGPQLVLDLEEVTLVDLDVVRFLRDCEDRGAKLLYCAPYLREWIFRERGAKG